MSAAHWNQLLEKTVDWDKDERYMATNDICNELAKDVKIDEALERRICYAVLKQLDDKSNDVQSVAVKCLSLLVKKINPAQIKEICDKMSTLLLEGNDALTDIYSIGLKTLISDAPAEMGGLIANSLCGRLLNGISRVGSEAVKRECLDILSDLLRRFGHLCDNDHEDVMVTLVRQLELEKASIRKRASTCLASLATVASDQLLNRLVETILEHIDRCERGASGSADSRTLIQTVGVVARGVGHRLARHLPRLVPLFLRFCGDGNDESQQSETANELREHCFPGLESFVLRCPREVAPYSQDIIRVCISFAAYDPNYSYADDEDEVEDDGEDMYDNDADFDEEVDCSDDDDGSWKVRKNAVRVLAAIIQTADAELLLAIGSRYGGFLVSRYKEREENVRIDVIACFNNLVQGLGVAAKAVASSIAAQNVYEECVRSLVQPVVAASCKQFDGQSPKSKTAAFSVLLSLVEVCADELKRFSSQLVKGVTASLKDRNQALQLEVLVFLRALFESSAGIAYRPEATNISALIITCIGSDWYKIIAESLRVLGALVAVLRPLPLPTMNSFGDSSMVVDITVDPCTDVALVRSIFAAIKPRLEVLDIDQEIKECAVVAVGKVFASVGDVLINELQLTLEILRRRLDNEILRIPTLRALSIIASSPLRLDLTEFVDIVEIGSYLKQQNRLLKTTALSSLAALVSGRGNFSLPSINSVLVDAAPLISDTDLYHATSAMKLCSCIGSLHGAASDTLMREVWPRCLQLATSPSLHGAALNSLVDLLKQLATSPIVQSHGFSPAMCVAELRTAAFAASAGHSRKLSFSNIAHCIAGVCQGNGDSTGALISEIIVDLQSIDNDRRQLALLTLSELGSEEVHRTVGVDQLRDLIYFCFDNGNEDVRVAAAQALGRVARNNLIEYLPILLQTSEQNRHQHFLLSALKELVQSCGASNDLAGHIEEIIPVLFEKCAVDDEGVRSMVAECLGSLAACHCGVILPSLTALAAEGTLRYEVSTDSPSKQHGAALSLWTMVNSLRFALCHAVNPTSEYFEPFSGAFEKMLNCLLFTDIEVRRAALAMVNTCLHHNFAIASKFLASILPVILDTFSFKSERVVDLGPFKHKVDDGLPLRKLALTCLESALSNRLSLQYLSVLMAQFSTKIVLLLADKDEIRQNAHQLIIRLISACPNLFVVDVLELLVEPLDKTITKKMTREPTAAAGSGAESAVGAEADRSIEVARSAIRLAIVANRLDAASLSRKWSEFYEKLSKRELTAALFAAVLADKFADV